MGCATEITKTSLNRDFDVLSIKTKQNAPLHLKFLRKMQGSVFYTVYLFVSVYSGVVTFDIRRSWYFQTVYWLRDFQTVKLTKNSIKSRLSDFWAKK